MLEQVSTSVKFVAFYTASKQGKTGLTVTVDLYDPSGTQIVTGGSATAIGGGLYAYTLSTNNSAEGEYAAIFKTSDTTVDAQHIPSLWVLGRAGVENLDAAVSSRSTLTAAQVNAEADAALADVGLTSTITGRIDQAISTRLAAADYTAPSAAPTASAIASQVRTELGTELGRIDAAISSRLAPSGTLATVTTLTNAPSVPSAATIASQVRTELSTELGRIDAPVSGATAPSPSTVATAVRTELATELARVDQNISSRLASSAYTAPANSDITSIKAKTDNLPASPAATGDIPSANITAIKAKTDLLNTDRLAQCSTVATTGAQLAAALS